MQSLCYGLSRWNQWVSLVFGIFCDFGQFVLKMSGIACEKLSKVNINKNKSQLSTKTRQRAQKNSLRRLKVKEEMAMALMAQEFSLSKRIDKRNLCVSIVHLAHYQFLRQFNLIISQVRNLFFSSLVRWKIEKGF